MTDPDDFEEMWRRLFGPFSTTQQSCTALAILGDIQIASPSVAKLVRIPSIDKHKKNKTYSYILRDVMPSDLNQPQCSREPARRRQRRRGMGRPEGNQGHNLYTPEVDSPSSPTIVTCRLPGAALRLGINWAPARNGTPCHTHTAFVAQAI